MSEGTSAPADQAPVLLQRPGKAPRTQKVDLGGGSWVEIKKSQTIEDTSDIQQATVTGEITAKAGADTVNMGRLALGAAPLQTLVSMVIRWGGPAFCKTDHDDGNGYLLVPTGHECDPLPVTPEALRGMLNGPGQIVLAAVEANNPAANKNGNLGNGDGQKP